MSETPEEKRPAILVGVFKTPEGDIVVSRACCDTEEEERTDVHPAELIELIPVIADPEVEARLQELRDLCESGSEEESASWNSALEVLARCIFNAGRRYPLPTEKPQETTEPTKWSPGDSAIPVFPKRDESSGGSLNAGFDNDPDA